MTASSPKNLPKGKPLQRMKDCVEGKRAGEKSLVTGGRMSSVADKGKEGGRKSEKENDDI